MVGKGLGTSRVSEKGGVGCDEYRTERLGPPGGRLLKGVADNWCLDSILADCGWTLDSAGFLF